MTLNIEQIVGFLWSVLLLAVSFIFRAFSTRLDNIEKKQSDFELYAANNLVKDTELKEVMKPLFNKLDRIEDKLNQANYELARKQDKP